MLTLFLWGLAFYVVLKALTWKPKYNPNSGYITPAQARNGENWLGQPRRRKGTMSYDGQEADMYEVEYRNR